MNDDTQNSAAPAVADVGPPKTRFFFKSRKEKDAEGKEVVVPAPKAVELVIPFLTLDSVVDIINSNDEKQQSLLLEAVNSVILGQARSLVDEDPEKARTEGIDLTQLTWDFISKIPPATRRGGGIADEVWEAFTADYVAVMQHHGKTKEKAETGAKLLAKRFAPVKDNKKVIKVLTENLLLWYTNTDKAEDFQQVYEALISKSGTLLEKDEEAIIAAI